MNPVTAATPVAVKQVAFWEQKLVSLGLALLPLPHLIVSQALMWLSSDGESDVKGAGDDQGDSTTAFLRGITVAFAKHEAPCRDPSRSLSPTEMTMSFSVTAAASSSSQQKGGRGWLMDM